MRIVLAPVGAGKTEAALQALITTLDQHPFARVWVLLASRRQEAAFRQRLIEYSPERRTYFNVEFFNFYDLYQRLLHMAGQPARCLDETARAGLLRAVVTQLLEDRALVRYTGIAETPGFIRILGDLIYELKQNLVYPENFLDYAQESQTATSKDRELALIYDAYQRQLQTADLVDREGQGWLALSRMQHDDRLPEGVDLLIVDGYDQFTPLQATLLARLARRIPSAMVTLTTVPGREDTIGRRFREALHTLQAACETISVPVQIEERQGTQGRSADLQHLVETVFLPGAPHQPATESVIFIEAPDAVREAGAVLRRVKRLLLDGCPPDEVLIALRDWPRYGPQVQAFGRAYEVPLALHYGEALTENPMIAALLDLLALHERDFPRRELLDVLRSPYVAAPGLDEASIELLDRISQAFVVTRGREHWLHAVEKQATRPQVNDYGDTIAPLLDPATAKRLHRDLEEFFDQVTPEPSALPQRYIGWLDELIGYDPQAQHDDDDELHIDPAYTVNMIASLRATLAGADAAIEGGIDPAAAEAIIARDLHAMDSLKRQLRTLITADDLLTTLRDSRQAPQPVPWERFSGDLRSAIGTAQISAQPGRSGRVLVTTATDARGLPHRHVFVLGLSEGLFPRQIPEDPLYLDSERAALQRSGIMLETQAERAADDGLFYELICLPRESLTLSRPNSQDGQPWSPSHLWRAALALYDPPQVTTLRAGAVTPPHEAATRSEAALVLADGLSISDPVEAVHGLYNWLREGDHALYWQMTHSRRNIEARRLSPSAPHDQYTGRLHHPILIDDARMKLSQRRKWSATQLNDYAQCGFRFFAKRLLRLDAFEEPEEGMDSLTLGSIYHMILQFTYKAIQGERIQIAEANREAALAILEREAAKVFATAAETFGFRPDALWAHDQRAMLERLRRLVATDFSDDNPITKKFGSAPRYNLRQEMPFGREDVPPVEVDLGEAGTLLLNGMIDRVDRVGDALIVIDYKSGSSRFSVEEMREGRSYQMIVYLLAARSFIERQWPDYRVAGGFFWHLRKAEISGVLTDDDSEVFDSALGYLTRYVEAMREGVFAVDPPKTDRGRCTSYCEYSQLCRLCGLNLRKPT